MIVCFSGVSNSNPLYTPNEEYDLETCNSHRFNVLVQLDNCPQSYSRIIFFSQHCVSFSGSRSTVHKNRAVESGKENCDQVFCRSLKNVRVCRIWTVNAVESEFLVSLNFFVQVAAFLFPAVKKELVVVLLRVEDQHLFVHHFDDVSGEKNKKRI